MPETLAEIEESLHHAHAVHPDDRGEMWQPFVDRLEAQRIMAIPASVDSG